jgi:hypothetical protein
MARDPLPRGESIFACPDGGVSLRFDRKGISGIETSRREAAELFRIAASTAVKWLQRLHHDIDDAARPTERVGKA